MAQKRNRTQAPVPATRTRQTLAFLDASLPHNHALAIAARNLAVAMACDASRKPYNTGRKATALWRVSLALHRAAHALGHVG